MAITNRPKQLSPNNPVLTTALRSVDEAEVNVLMVSGWTKTIGGWTHPTIQPQRPISRTAAVTALRHHIIKAQLG